MQNKPNVLVLGASGIGIYLAVWLSEAGYDVTMIAQTPDVVQKIQERGLNLVSEPKEHKVNIPTFVSCQELDGTFDLVLHTTPITTALDIAREVLPYLHEQSMVVSFQKGFFVEQLAEVVGRSRVVGCVYRSIATLFAPTAAKQTHDKQVIIGYIDQCADARLADVQTVLSNAVAVEMSDNISVRLYSELIADACVTSIGTTWEGCWHYGCNSDRVRDLYIGIMREAIAVADAMGWTIPAHIEMLNKMNIQQNDADSSQDDDDECPTFDYYDALRDNDSAGNIETYFSCWLIDRHARRIKLPTPRPLEHHQPTDVDFINGYIVAKGQQYNVPTPINALVVQLIHEIEAYERAIGEANFDVFEALYAHR